MIARGHAMHDLPALLIVLSIVAACRPGEGDTIARVPSTTIDSSAIGDTLRSLIVQAYDLSRPDVVDRIMTLYPDRGPVVSAASGYITTSVDSLRSQVASFYDRVGQNMQQPRWEWLDSHVRVLGPDAAVITAAYRVPHTTPEGRPHVIGGAWTMVFERLDGRWVIVQEHLSDRPPQ